jgi:nitrite reductase/ring-hydroxylating ferredoxin subunit
MSRRVAVCTLDSLPEGSFRVIAVDGHEILLARLNNDIYAVDAVCTHESGPLGEGYLEGDAIVCPIHFTMFSLTYWANFGGSSDASVTDVSGAHRSGYRVRDTPKCLTTRPRS